MTDSSNQRVPAPAGDGRYRLLVEAVTDYAIYMLDPGGFVSNWNAGAERIKGYLPEEIIGQHFSRFYTEVDRANGLPERALSIAAREGRFESEGVRLRKDGSRFVAHAVIDAIRDDDGKLAGFAKIALDPGATGTATITLKDRSFARWDPGVHDWVVDPGDYAVVIAASATDVRTTHEVTVA